MRRWYVVALRDTPSTDGRVLLGRIHTIDRPGHPEGTVWLHRRHRWGLSRTEDVHVRIRGGRVEALLRWRDRGALAHFDGPVRWSVDRVELHDPTVTGFTVPTKPNPWPGLPRRAHRSEW